jgi:hypothetical protein
MWAGAKTGFSHGIALCRQVSNSMYNSMYPQMGAGTIPLLCGSVLLTTVIVGVSLKFFMQKPKVSSQQHFGVHQGSVAVRTSGKYPAYCSVNAINARKSLTSSLKKKRSGFFPAVYRISRFLFCFMAVVSALECFGTITSVIWNKIWSSVGEILVGAVLALIKPTLGAALKYGHECWVTIFSLLLTPVGYLFRFTTQAFVLLWSLVSWGFNLLCSSVSGSFQFVVENASHLG